MNHLGVVGAWWLPRSSKPVAGRAERAAVGSTPIHSRYVPFYTERPGLYRFIHSAYYYNRR